jgi:hypothetical protein
MENDPLARFRRRPAAGQEPVTENQKPPTVHPFTPRPQGGLPAYKAFHAKDRVLRLDIRQTDIVVDALPYHVLVGVRHDPACTKIMLVYPNFMVIKVYGKNLGEVARAIKNETCEFIQDFDPRLFAQPDPSEPIIEKIEVMDKPGAEKL